MSPTSVFANDSNRHRIVIDRNEDFNSSVYRLSISWARLFPTGFEDQSNPEGVMYYDRIIR
jgi:beta-glucosidase/6-phospho-beta-glucosidase/beta-galactosidase